MGGGPGAFGGVGQLVLVLACRACVRGLTLSLSRPFGLLAAQPYGAPTVRVQATGTVVQSVVGFLAARYRWRLTLPREQGRNKLKTCHCIKDVNWMKCKIEGSHFFQVDQILTDFGTDKATQMGSYCRPRYSVLRAETDHADDNCGDNGLLVQLTGAAHQPLPSSKSLARHTGTIRNPHTLHLQPGTLPTAQRHDTRAASHIPDARTKQVRHRT